jgi:signal transduction histidine kinase/putative methionine-R-sulfoxide reductase with GAF domain
MSPAPLTALAGTALVAATTHVLASVPLPVALGMAGVTGLGVWGAMMWRREHRRRRVLAARLAELAEARSQAQRERDDLLQRQRENDEALQRQRAQADLLRGRSRALEKILAVSARINATRNRGELAAKITAAATEIMGWGEVVLYLWNDATGSYEPAAIEGLAADTAAAVGSRQVPAAEYAAMASARNRYSNCYLVPSRDDADEAVLDELLTPGSPLLAARPWEDGLQLVAPLVTTDGHTHGFLSLAAPSDGLLPGVVEVRQLEFLMQQAATALESVDAFDRLARNNAELSLASEKLDSLAEMKRNFVANVSHELRTPLTSISAYSELLQQNMTKLSGEALSEFLAVIHTESQKLSAVIDDLLELNSMEQGRPMLDQAEVDLREMLAGLEDSWLARARERQQRLTVSCCDGGLRLSADALLLKQLLSHLVGNALKFTPAGGEIRVAACETGTAVRLTVEDTGIGIPENKLGEIFDRFYQVDSSSTRQYNGQGLGLAICHDIVNHHDGRIWAENIEPCGTRFSVLLPRRAAVLQPREPGVLTGLPFEAGEFLQRIMHWISESLGIQMATLMVPDAEHDVLRVRAAIGLPEAVVQSVSVRRGTGYVGRVWETGQTLLVEDVTTDGVLDRDVSEPRYSTPSLLCVPLLAGDDLVGVVTVNNRVDGRALDDDDRVFLESLAPRLASLLARYEEWQSRAREFQAIRETLRTTTAVGQTRHENLAEVCQEVCLATARAVMLPDDELENLAFALQFYDVGLSRVPPQLLHKPGRLDADEQRLVQRHVTESLDILASLEPGSRVRQIILHHHEDFDGGGYPSGLAGEAIPLGARLVRLTDALTALLSRRPWRGAFSLEQAVTELREGAGRQYCPRMTEVFLAEVARRRERILSLQHEAAGGADLHRPVLDVRDVGAVK